MILRNMNKINDANIIWPISTTGLIIAQSMCDDGEMNFCCNFFKLTHTKPNK